MIRHYAHTLWAFARARYLNARLRDRQAIERHHARQLDRLMAERLPRFPYYEEHLTSGFSNLPIVDKAELMANFERCNLGGFSAQYVREALAEKRDNEDSLFFGQSTGTSGNRGYYVISEKERYIWLGTILAKTLPDALWRKHRVVVALPGMSTLYSSANSGSRIKLAFFDTADGMHTWEEDLVRFDPDTIVSSPKVLRYLAERGKLRASNIFSGAEVLDPFDKELIEAATGAKVREIYMATEGLFGVSCPHGHLHLAEDVVHFEWEEAAPGSTLKKPIVTDFTRSSQAMVRYRMNDLLELSDEACPCGSAFQRVNAVHGRADDCFVLPAHSGKSITVTPDVIRNSLIDAYADLTDFRAIQTGKDSVRVELPPSVCAEKGAQIERGLAAAFERLGASANIKTVGGITPLASKKLRRVSREWRG
ncbi:MAG: F390 synthetase-related protein [Pseudomonadota bacterium]